MSLIGPYIFDKYFFNVASECFFSSIAYTNQIIREINYHAMTSMTQFVNNERGFYGTQYGVRPLHVHHQWITDRIEAFLLTNFDIDGDNSIKVTRIFNSVLPL